MKIIRADKIVICAIVLYIIILFLTNFYINYLSDVAKDLKIEEKVALRAEQNPFYRYFLQFQNLRYMWSVVILPAFLVSVYYYVRQKYKELNPELLEAIAVFFFVSYLYDFLNDISILLGVLIK